MSLNGEYKNLKNISKTLNLKNKKLNKDSDKQIIDLNLLDKTPISKLLTFSAKELFQIQEQAYLEFEKANYRKKWIEGIIELKYKTTIESAYKRAIEYFNSEPLQEMDKCNEDILTEYIQDVDDDTNNQSNRNNNYNKNNYNNKYSYNNKDNHGYSRYKDSYTGNNNISIIKVEFYRSVFDEYTSDTLERPRIRKRFTLLKVGGKNA